MVYRYTGTTGVLSIHRDLARRMTQSSKTASELVLCSPEYYLNREASWVEFNARVLHEAMDDRTPLLERLKFLAIFSSNLDEYFMVRVAALREQLAAGVVDRAPDGLSAQAQLDLISQKLHPLVTKQHQHFEDVLRPQLAEHGIHLLDYIDLDPEQRTYLQHYFEEQIFPVLTPLAVDPAHPFPHISNLSISLAVMVKDPDTKHEYFARVKVPHTLPRFLPLPEELRLRQGGKPAVWTGVPLEQVIAHNLESLFPGMTIQEYYPFRITRDADLSVQDDDADDLLLAIEQELRKRRLGGSVVRMEVPVGMPAAVRDLLCEELELTSGDIYEVDGLIGLRDLWSFMALSLPELKDKPWKSVVPPRLRRDSDVPPDSTETAVDEGRNFFATIRKQDVLLHHPYHSFSATVQSFITYAAHDPDVLAIKMTLYRTSGDSPIVNALIAAAENGKQVVVLVELKARFDEENNIIWARKLEQVGVHVVYGLVGLKTHTKVVLVVRREDSRIRRYVHIGTGNYNPKTARLYTDLGLLSCRDDLGADLTDLFNYLTGHAKQRSYRKLLVAPVSLRDRMVEMIHREADHARQGKSARIVAKMNALVDPAIIAALYEASQAGVQIDLIIRGICCLRPGVAGVSDNIRVISIIGRLLEHSRIFYFFNNGDEQVFIGSADWMPRNLDRRVEAVVPVEEPSLAKELQEILGIMLADNRQAWDMQPDGSYIQRQPPAGTQPLSSQQTFMTMAQAST
jgi:polyphosphate kinase